MVAAGWWLFKFLLDDQRRLPKDDSLFQVCLYSLPSILGLMEGYPPPWNPGPTELKNDCACVTGDPVSEAVGAKISTWATHFEWKTLESLDFAVKFQVVFRYETVVFRRYVLSLLLVVLLRKFEAYLVYLSLIWGKFLRRFSCFQKFRHFSYMFPGFPVRISDMRSRFSALSPAPQIFETCTEYFILRNCCF